jgi:AcrR family transcriptional regulator
MTWKRARSDEQKQIRRREILDAAAILLRESLPKDVSLNAIARKAGIAKSNVYRYFGSREEVLLTLLSRDLSEWSATTCAVLASPNGPRTPEEIGALVARGLVERHQMTSLLSQLTSVMEHNVSVDFLAEFKLDMVQRFPPVALAMTVAIPQLSVPDAMAFVQHLHPIIAGLWPMHDPPQVVRDVYARHPELALLHRGFEDSLADAAATLLYGLLARAEA